jgi:hypothetical protein
VADGAGSGSWTAQAVGGDTVIVNSASDLPAAAAGVRTLAASTTYQISGSVSIGSDRLVMSAGTAIVGDNPLVDGIVTTNSGACITSAANFFLSTFFITCSAGAVFDLNGTSTQVALIENVRITSCDTIGAVDAWGLLSINDMLVSSTTTTGFVFTGANGNLRVSGGTFVVSTGIVFDLGTATFDGVSFSHANIDNASGVTGIDVAASGANINTGGQGTISFCTFLTHATGVVGFTHGDPKWTMAGSPGAPASGAHGSGSIEGSALTTTFTGTGVGNDVIVNFGAAWVADATKKFTVSTAGRFTYTGTKNIEILFSSSIFATIAGGAARTYHWYLAKNGTIVASSVAAREYDGTNPGSVSCVAVTELDENDYVELYVRAETATTAITADTVSITVVQLGV